MKECSRPALLRWFRSLGRILWLLCLKARVKRGDGRAEIRWGLWSRVQVVLAGGTDGGGNDGWGDPGHGHG